MSYTAHLIVRPNCKLVNLVKFLLLDPGESAQANLTHPIGGALEALFGIGAVLGRLHELSHDVIELLNLPKGSDSLPNYS